MLGVFIEALASGCGLFLGCICLGCVHVLVVLLFLVVVCFGLMPLSYVFRGGAVRLWVSLVAFGFVYCSCSFILCCLDYVLVLLWSGCGFMLIFGRYAGRFDYFPVWGDWLLSGLLASWHVCGAPVTG